MSNDYETALRLRYKNVEVTPNSDGTFTAVVVIPLGGADYRFAATERVREQACHMVLMSIRDNLPIPSEILRLGLGP